MISPSIQQKVRVVLANWLNIYKINKKDYHTYPGCFLSTISTINNDIIIPVYTVVSLDTSVFYTLFGLKDVQATLCMRSKYTLNCKTITAFLDNCNTNNLVKIKFKNNIYIIGKGCIFDEDMNPLLIMSLSAKYFKFEGARYTRFHTPTLHISPTALSDPALSPYIIKYFIPECNREICGADFNIANKSKFRKEFQKITVQIHDLDGFIKKCPIPNLTENVTEKVNSILQSVKDLPNII